MPCFCRCFVEAVKKTRHWIYLRRVGGKDALGIAAESPQRSEDLQRKARPEGLRPIYFFYSLILLFHNVNTYIK